MLGAIRVGSWGSPLGRVFNLLLKITQTSKQKKNADENYRLRLRQVPYAFFMSLEKEFSDGTFTFPQEVEDIHLPRFHSSS